MTEPTDHRAEAADWLGKAEREYSRSLEHAVPAALLAIAHDLHRIADASDGLNRAINALMAIAGEASRIANALETPPDDQPGPGNVEADFTEDGQIRQVYDSDGDPTIWIDR